ncbi:hypothetical protein J1614_005618 [Plenodomus biglobosus]|nr:hypothetical protein J1614_005618 [Plenodomus biglobosus]
MESTCGQRKMKSSSLLDASFEDSMLDADKRESNAYGGPATTLKANMFQRSKNLQGLEVLCRADNTPRNRRNVRLRTAVLH